MYNQFTKDLRHVAPVDGDEQRRDTGQSSSSVLWHHDKRKWRDKSWAILFGVLYFQFIAVSIHLLSNAHLRYSFDDVLSSRGEKVSAYYEQDVISCCDEVNSIIDNSETTHSFTSLCVRNNFTSEERRLQSTRGKFIGDEGIFEAFEKRPDIVLIHIFATSAMTIDWIMLLGKYAKYTIFTIEWAKALSVVGFCLVLTVRGFPPGFIGLLVTCGYIQFLFKQRKRDLEHAANLITHGTAAFKESWRSLFWLIAVKILYLAQICIYVASLIASFENVNVIKRETTIHIVTVEEDHSSSDENYTISGDPEVVSELSCEFQKKPFVDLLVLIQTFAFAFTIMIFDQVRLYVVAMIVGSWRFHPDSMPSTIQALRTSLTKSIGSISSAAIFTTIAESFRRRNRSWLCCLGPQNLLLFPFQCIMCACGCFYGIVRIYTRFAVILHAFDGKSLYDSAMKCHGILRRRFVNGYISDYATSSTLATGSFMLSTILTLGSWAYLDVAFECSSFHASSGTITVWIVILLVALSSPLFGIFVLLAMNHVARAKLKQQEMEGDAYYGEFGQPNVYLPPLAAIFLGVVSKLCLDFISGIIKDSVDVMFLCFAIDEDNGINRGENEFDSIVKEMPEFIVAVPIQALDPESPVATGIVVSTLTPEAEVRVSSLARDDDHVAGDVDQNDWIVAVTRKSKDEHRYKCGCNE